MRDGALYKGRSTYRSDILATLKDGSTQNAKVYRGTSSYRSDLLFTLDGPLTFQEFIAVWYAVNYIY
jgi:hypothetical protein